MFNHFQEIEEFMLSRNAFGIKPGLERMNFLLHLLGHPEKSFKSVHIAGTNGKGSTIQFLNKALLSNGHRVGVFTSPSLTGLTGHIWCDDEEVDNREWISLMNDLYPIIQKLDSVGNHPTSFEIITAVSFVYFSKNVDIALIETGMGGRFDTTNSIQPILSIITNVSKDHTAFLGDEVEEIASHKAGIIKRNTPVILGDMDVHTLPVFQKEATEKGAYIYELYHDFTYTDIQSTSGMQEFVWQYGEEKHGVAISVKGIHQVKNASQAMMAIVLLKEQGFSIKWHKTLQGLNDTLLSGRFETIIHDPMIIIDGAHNPAGAKSFIKTVQTIFPNEEKHLIFAAYKDKDIQTMLDMYNPYFKTITLASFDDARAASAEYLFNLSTHHHKRMIPEWRDAVGAIVTEHKHSDDIYFITGSLAFITQVCSFISHGKYTENCDDGKRRFDNSSY